MSDGEKKKSIACDVELDGITYDADRVMLQLTVTRLCSAAHV